MKKYFAILITLLIICICIGSFAVYKVIEEKREVAEAESLSSEFLQYSPVDYFKGDYTYKDIYNNFKPKLEEMKSINSDVIGWLYIPVTNINYPVLQGEDNSYYLTHSVSNKYSAAGSVFIDKRGINNSNTIIYGHNMGRSSNVMFHDITNFADADYFDKVKVGYFIDENGITELSIFAYSLTSPQTEFYNDDVSIDFIKEKAINYREPKEGNLFTLSTCAYDYKDARAILSCVGNMVYSEY